MPTKATTSNGQNDEKAAKPTPVSAISSAALRSSALERKRWPQAPTATVASAEPSIVAVATTPTSSVPRPIASR